MPFILVCLWIQILLQLRRGIRDGKIDWQKRGSSESDDVLTQPENRRVRKFDFYSLFTFYFVLAMAIPAMVANAIYSNLFGEA